MTSQGALLLSSGGAKFVSMSDFAMFPSQPQTYSVYADESPKVRIAIAQCSIRKGMARGRNGKQITPCAQTQASD